jgi:hypothetical protein
MPDPEDSKDERSIVAGCLLMVVCLAVIAGVAVYVVTWRDADSGRALPKKVAIVVPLLAGALCYGIGTTILKVLGLPVLVKSEKESSGHPEDSGTNHSNNR